MRSRALILSTIFAVPTLAATAAFAQATYPDPADKRAVDAIDLHAPGNPEGPERPEAVSGYTYARYAEATASAAGLAQAAGGGHDAPQAIGPEAGRSANASVTLASGRVFADQGYTVTDNPVVEFDFTVEYEGWSFNLWHAESLSGERFARETDLTLGKEFEAGPFTGFVQGAYFIVPGNDIPEAMAGLRYPLSDACSLTGSYEAMWGGFKTRVTKVELSCDLPVSERATLSLAPAAAHDTDAGRIALGGTVEATYAVSGDIAIGAFVTGYASKESDAIVGIRVSRGF
ncbi:MAG TPA: hypothetical protein VHO23_03055 [Candidatus Paceibacterota bacterium]|nr:hypothetical protein [Candidatus Paceibacterota bacterium]